MVSFSFLTISLAFLPAISFNDEILEVTATESHETSLTYTTFNTKLYVFSIEEIKGEQQSNDSLAGTSRKLDYYEVNDGVSGIAVKKYNGTKTGWWLRSAAGEARVMKS